MTNLPSLAALKAQAKSLRTSLAATGHTISHAQSLELLAKQLGHRDWNTLHAAAGNSPALLVQLGQNISGLYMGRPFTGKVIRASDIGNGARSQFSVRFDTPVNISKFDSMVIERRQVTATINRDGHSSEKTSDGTPHMAVDLT
ncbi:MAG: glyoxalase superfamily protein [Yoonia sp.]